jgi:hypothetical protein
MDLTTVAAKFQVVIPKQSASSSASVLARPLR